MKSRAPALFLPPSSHGSPARGVAATPIAFVRAIVDAYRAYGADPARALALAEIEIVRLDDPAQRVTARQLELLSAVAMQELDDEALGWFSRRLRWGSYGMLCRASLGAPDLGVAIQRWCRHHRLLTDEIALDLEVAKAIATLRIGPGVAPTPARALSAEMAEFRDVTLLRYLLGYACWAIDSRIPLLEARFAYPPPPHAAAYPLLFPCAIHFDAAATAIRFDAAYLALPIRRDEAALRAMLQDALPLTVLQYRRDRLLLQRVREVLKTRILSGRSEGVSAEAVASELHVSPRTLHRHLHEEGCALQQLKDEVRRDRAIELLNRTQLSIKSIAQAAGFQNEKSFARAFRTWTGKAPSAFRCVPGMAEGEE